MSCVKKVRDDVQRNDRVRHGGISDGLRTNSD